MLTDNIYNWNIDRYSLFKRIITVVNHLRKLKRRRCSTADLYTIRET